MTTEITTAQQRMDSYKEAIHNVSPQLVSALGGPSNLEKFKQAIFTCATVNPKILLCSANSIAVAAIQCAHLQLFPLGITGDAYLVPYRDVCKLILGYRGLAKLARRSGMISKIVARPVYPADEFAAVYGTEDTLIHRPDMSVVAHDDKDITHVYCICYYKSGVSQFEVMNRADIEAHRRKHASPKSTAWRDHWLPMAQKTVFKLGAGYLPMSVETQFAVEIDDRAEHGRDQMLDKTPPNLARLIDSAMTADGGNSGTDDPIVIDSQVMPPENAADTAPLGAE